MIKTVLENEPKSTFTLVYGNKSNQETIFKEELDALAQKFIARLNIKYVFSQEETKGAEYGRIDKATVHAIVREKFNHLRFDEAFLCGPEEMIQTVSKTLSEDGFSKKNIHFELFVSSTNTKEVYQPGRHFRNHGFGR